MRQLALIAAACAAMAGCSSPENEVGETAETPTARPAGRDAIYEAARLGPEEFVRAIYAAYAADAMGAPPRPGQDPIYSRMMNARIGADALRPGGEPTLDRDPLCDCQDVEGLALRSVAVSQAAAAEAQAAVAFVNGGETKSLTLILQKEGPMWRVEDVLVDGRPPLSEAVMEGIS